MGRGSRVRGKRDRGEGKEATKDVLCTHTKFHTRNTNIMHYKNILKNTNKFYMQLRDLVHMTYRDLDYGLYSKSRSHHSS